MIEPLKFTDLGSFAEFSTMEEMYRLRQKVEKLESGPGGIMEMKQTIANKEAEIAKLEEELLEWKARAVSLFNMVPGDVTVGELKNAKDAILKELGNK
jgi:hypothetical protein